MTVYVDELKVWPHARHACFKKGSAHLTADGLAELHAFARRLSLKAGWFQAHPMHPHYDLSPGKHAQALAIGAMFVSAREQAMRRRAAAPLTRAVVENGHVVIIEVVQSSSAVDVPVQTILRPKREVVRG